MKEVERVSIGGFAFTLEDDAARLAGEYLDQLEAHYSTREGGSEILEGIEERMAELLRERSGREGVVSRQDIEAIIAILGRPEQIEEEGGDSPVEPANDGEKGADDGKKATHKRKLYRSLSDKVVAGVCSGLGAYFNVDTALFRIGFAAGTLALALPDWHHANLTVRLLFPALYLILWISMPPARTVRQRWEQRGEDGSIHGIQQTIENGAREIGDAARSVGQSPVWGRLGKAFEKLIGLILLIVGFSGLFAGGVWTLGSGRLGVHSDTRGLFGLGRLYDQGLGELYRTVPDIANVLLQPGTQILLLLVCFLPFLGLLYGGLQLLIGFKSPKWHPGLVIFILWLLSIIAAGILVATGAISSELLTV